jgi:hypothetical protein
MNADALRRAVVSVKLLHASCFTFAPARTVLILSVGLLFACMPDDSFMRTHLQKILRRRMSADLKPGAALVKSRMAPSFLRVTSPFTHSCYNVTARKRTCIYIRLHCAEGDFKQHRTSAARPDCGNSDTRQTVA